MRRPAPLKKSDKSSAAGKSGSANAKKAAKAAARTKAARHPKPKLPSRMTNLGIQYRFDRAIRRALTGPAKGSLDGEVINDIFAGMGETSLAADDPFVTTALESAANVEGPVLQCGAGPMTLLLAIAMQRRSQYLWTLEHNTSWAHMLRSTLSRYDIRAGQILNAPAEAFGDHIWYVVDVKHLPRDIGLVVCDGSNVLPNGMRGVVRRLENHLSHRCVLLVRNTSRPKDLDFASKWAKSQSAPFILNDKGEPFVKIALRDQRTDNDLISDRVLTVYDGLREPGNLCQSKSEPLPRAQKRKGVA
ncbi:MAG: hypothetical protein AB8B93_06650 [Pseudomonadales bacterium]